MLQDGLKVPGVLDLTGVCRGGLQPGLGNPVAASAQRGLLRTRKVMKKRRSLALPSAASMRDLLTIALIRSVPLLRRSVPGAGILAAERTGAIMNKSELRLVGGV